MAEEITPKTIFIEDKEPTYNELKNIVGGYLEFAYDDGKTQIICNEEGKIYGHPYNKKATILWSSMLGYVPDDVLVGNIVILKGKGRLKWWPKKKS